MTCGVYQIWLGDYYYFGSAEDCEQRLKRGHLQPLKRGKHNNKKMQHVYNKYQTFDYQIIIDCADRDAAYAYEQDFIDTHFGLDKCLNLNADASKPPSCKGKPKSEEQKRKQSEAMTGKNTTPLSEEHKQNISKALTGKKRGPSLKKGRKLGPLSEETKQRISKKLIGHTPWNKGKPASKSQCPHCYGWFAAAMMARWHGDNCKFAPVKLMEA